MNPLDRLRRWWQVRTGEEDTPFDGDAPAWFISLLVHLALMVMLTVASAYIPPQAPDMAIETTLPVDEEELEIPKEFVSSDEAQEFVGAMSEDGSAMAEAMALTMSPVNNVPPPETFVALNATISDPVRDMPTANKLVQDIAVRGATGVGTTGAVGAVDRITQEILLSLEQRETLVVWLFDRSISMEMQRKQVNDRMKRVYEELGVIQAAGNDAFVKHGSRPLLSSVVAFGKDVNLLTKKPTHDLAEIQKAIDSIRPDEAGEESIFQAIGMAVEHYRWFRLREPRRNVILVGFTDEAGSDQHLLDQTVVRCRQLAVPVYIVGVPAPFGRKQVDIKYVNPDKKYEQVAQWVPLDQGPESFLPEFVQLYSPDGRPEEPIDSGYGPYALTRLCYETGGIYFAVHPNRNSRRYVSAAETKTLASRLSFFFDPEVMRRYRPDYISIKDYQKLITDNMAREALVRAAEMSGISQLAAPRLMFPKRDEAEFANMLTEAQKDAAMLEPRINQLFDVLKQGEKDRPKLTQPRWQAGYDLAMGRVLAAKVRTETYNLMLAKAKQGLKFENEKNDTWELEPSDTISVGSILEKQAADAKKYLERVVMDHPDTPWAHYAKRELDSPFGWEWKERFTGVNAPRMGDGGDAGPAPLPQDDQARMLKRKPAPPPPPKL